MNEPHEERERQEGLAKKKEQDAQRAADAKAKGDAKAEANWATNFWFWYQNITGLQSFMFDKPIGLPLCIFKIKYSLQK